MAKERKIVEAVKSPIVVALEEIGAITNTTEDATKTPIPRHIQGMDSSVINNTFRGAVVEDVRTVFERRNDTTIYIPSFGLFTINQESVRIPE
ncbi:MAG: hypothetical protein KGI69_03505 [Patescibacteria group bacterium]|nr:hypothetical protein [Patescibacteria group bacterium]